MNQWGGEEKLPLGARSRVRRRSVRQDLRLGLYPQTASMQGLPWAPGTPASGSRRASSDWWTAPSRSAHAEEEEAMTAAVGGAGSNVCVAAPSRRCDSAPSPQYLSDAIADGREQLVVVDEQIAASVGRSEQIGELEVHFGHRRGFDALPACSREAGERRCDSTLSPVR